MKKDTLRVLRTQQDYEAALKEFGEYFGKNEPKPRSPEGERFELLGVLIAKYEEEHYPIDAADPVEVIRLAMESNGYSRLDLAAVLGSSPRATEILNRKRELTIEHIRKLRAAWHIPADALIGGLQYA